MDTDPLQDTVPPRYAIESDEEEDEFNPLSHGKVVREPLTINIKGVGPFEGVGNDLIIAFGDAGRSWAQGASLEQQRGGVFVNEIQVGLVFTPSWTKSIIIISELTTALPIWAMNPYAQSVLDFFKPARLALLDTYPVPVYITPQPLLFHEAPVRYLSTVGGKPPASNYHPFSPPNLIQSTSAAFLSIIYVSLASLATPSAVEPPIKATLLLLPSPHIPQARSSELSRSSAGSVSLEEYANDGLDGWSRDMMQGVDACLLGVEGTKVGRAWKAEGKGSASAIANGGRGRRGDVGDGGMYI
ncbi:uncharacterized protein STEHIDRAFT_126306 [Stereum hirsutum FP-91666 SS1]|uniref:Proteasome assembly chaperone 1 n=1 Tax=Stereum hirsutum (strain FP-91666) TaxID=721885 RepID=R7RXU0_STEHR|nr:uncharacterized protein STEHIDRAFT_126306 [Stereum hirsutum FP-91666 SS1]EIM79608.1 hypothetical protein STEHIDRAFT_126306 [Stereum hirsutum FP-91666 SS1]